MKPNQNPEKKPWPADALYAPLSPPVRLITRSDAAQIRLNYLANVEGVDLRLYRKSPSEEDAFEAYLATPAGLVVPKSQIRELIGILQEIAAELDLIEREEIPRRSRA